MDDKQRPADTLRDGSLKATLWRNEGENGSFVSTQFAKTYTDRDGKPRDTNSFASSELLRVSELARQAYTRSNELRHEFASERGQAYDERGPHPDDQPDLYHSEDGNSAPHQDANQRERPPEGRRDNARDDHRNDRRAAYQEQRGSGEQETGSQGRSTRQPATRQDERDAPPPPGYDR